MSTNGFWLESNSPEYDLVKYHLTASTSQLGILEKLNIWKINNTELQYRYERRTNGMLKVQGWHDAENLDKENSLEQLCIRGFHLDPSATKGMEFSTGIINLDDAVSGLDQCFLLLEIAIGRSFVYDGNLSQASIPHGYDSLYIPDQPLDRNKDGKFSLQEYQSAATFDNRNPTEYNHRYFITDINQVIPKYIVRFRLANPKQAAGLFEAMTNQILHNNRNLQTQNIGFIDPITLLPPETNITNDFHGGNSINNQGGLNSNFDTKKYIPIEKLYQQATEEINYLENDSSFLSKNKWINRQLTTIEDKVREINLNYVDLLSSIDASVEEIKGKLQFFIREKLELCLSIEIELRRQLEQIEWYNNIIVYELKKYQHYIVECGHSNDVLKKHFMLEFLKLWKQHSLLSNTLNRLKPNELAVISNIHGDIKVNTNIQLYIDPFYAANNNTTTNNLQNTTATMTNSTMMKNDEKKSVTQNLPNIPNDNNYQPYLHSFTQRAVANEIFNTSNHLANPVVTGATNKLSASSNPNSPGKQQQDQGMNGIGGKIFHVSPIQSIIEQDMEKIQEFIHRESHNQHVGLRLPLSISRPFLSGNSLNIYQQNNPTLLVSETNQNRKDLNQFAAPIPGLTMHSLIENLKADMAFAVSEENNPASNPSYFKAMSGLGLENLENVSTIADIDAARLKNAFHENLPDLLGYSADADLGGPTTIPVNNANPPTSKNLAQNNSNNNNNNNNTLRGTGNVANVSNNNNNNNNKQAGGVSNPFTTPLADFNLPKEQLQELTSMPPDQLQQFLMQFYPQLMKQYSLSELSIKKQKQLQVKFLLNEARANNPGNNELTIGLNNLRKSKLLLDQEHETIFFSLPFFNKLPILNLIYSTIDHRRDLEELYSKTSKNRNPTLIVIRSGEYRFGAYLNQAPLPTASWNGNPQCFLFSLSLNLKLPFHGRSASISLGNDDEMTNSALALMQEPKAFYGTNEILMLGDGDIVLDAKLINGMTELESSYGMGLKKKGGNAKGGEEMDLPRCLLAGNQRFFISDLEVWTIQY